MSMWSPRQPITLANKCTIRRIAILVAVQPSDIGSAVLSTDRGRFTTNLRTHLGLMENSSRKYSKILWSLPPNRNVGSGHQSARRKLGTWFMYLPLFLSISHRPSSGKNQDLLSYAYISSGRSKTSQKTSAFHSRKTAQSRLGPRNLQPEAWSAPGWLLSLGIERIKTTAKNSRNTQCKYRLYFNGPITELEGDIQGGAPSSTRQFDKSCQPIKMNFPWELEKLALISEGFCFFFFFGWDTSWTWKHKWKNP